MRSGRTAALVGALILLTNCGEAVPVDKAARKAEDDSRAAGRRVEDAAASKVSKDRDAAFRAREADAASRTEREIEGSAGGAENAPAPATQQ